MNLQRLSRLDLNLLVALQALLEEKSVTRAAERLFVTQPAMSRILQRLRDQLDDQLFTRSGNELVPTPRALELESGLPVLLDNIIQLVATDEFSPANFRGELTLAVPEFFAFELVAFVTDVIARSAPGLTLSVSSDLDATLEEELASGVLDFAVDLERNISKDFSAVHLTDVTPAIWMRGGHPLANEACPTLEQILQYPFVQYYMLISKRVSAKTSARFDRTLHDMGLSRKKALVTNQLMTAMETLCRSDYLMVATQYGLRQEREFFDLVQKPFPANIPHQGTVPFMLVQHKRTMQSPIHKWLQGVIVDGVKRMDTALEKPW